MQSDFTIVSERASGEEFAVSGCEIEGGQLLEGSV